MPPRTVALKTDVLQPGAVLSGKFRVERVIGAGGMGMVVAAFHLQLERRVALKFLLPEMLRSEDIVARFFREAKAAAKIQSEHVVRVLDVGTLDNGAPYMVMEYLEGRDLSEVLKARGPLPVADAVLYVLQACEALAEAHRAGIVHRDLKPANLFLSQRPDGSATVKVLDFGISKATLLSDPVDTALTREASTLGSPAYMSPEQLRSARDVDPRTDVWSLGVVLHELLTGVTAFQASTLPELHVAILAQPPSSVRVRRPDVPPGLESVIARCLEKDPRARFSNVGELAAALADFSPPSGLLHVERASRTAGGTRAPYSGSVPPTMQSPPGAGPALPQAPPAPQLPPFGATYPQASPVTVPGAPLGASASVPHGVPYGGHTPQPSLDPLGPRAPSAGMTLAWIAIILVVGFVVVFGGACVVCAGIVGAS